jgi:hypothetical protein
MNILIVRHFFRVIKNMIITTSYKRVCMITLFIKLLSPCEFRSSAAAVKPLKFHNVLNNLSTCLFARAYLHVIVYVYIRVLLVRCKLVSFNELYYRISSAFVAVKFTTLWGGSRDRSENPQRSVIGDVGNRAHIAPATPI